MEAKYVFYTELLRALAPAIAVVIAWLLPSPGEILRRRREREAAKACTPAPKEGQP